MAHTTLTADEIDDVLYFTRGNEVEELKQTLSELLQKHSCSAKDVLEASVHSETGNTVLHFCSANGFVDLLKDVLNQLKPSEQEGVANGKAADKPQLINHQNQQGSTALHWAAYNGQLDAVKVLVQAGANMWIKNSAGHLAMFEAERAEKSGVVQFLLEAGGGEVEKTGREGKASEEDEVVVQGGDGVEQSETGLDALDGQANGGGEVEMGGA
ncbi:hypothetical protein LTR62_008451 [Meristemomyces frigidus]|uniref:Ankyrin repeat-containing protein YAR1 n=1 Tax=Meristemomyces frigidus TaxID=1508187 RepID=A0AAN7TMT4_9PEZI|nr:hypothetical protein LTR62_008451 [Meristemomyces frigidus]